MNCDLFGDPVIQLTKEKKASVYYVAISGIQKAVRRGMLKQALECTAAAYSIWPYKLWQRLHVILLEDCAGNLDAVRKFHAYRGGCKDLKGLLSLVAEMAQGQKTREVIMASWFVGGKVQELQKHGLTQADYPLLHELRDRWDLEKFEAYDDMGFVQGKDEWLIDFAERIQRTVESMAPALPWLHSVYFSDQERAETSDECPIDETVDGIIPLSAVDGHTRPGKIAINILCKQSPPPDTSSRGKKETVFQWEGGLARNKQCKRLLEGMQKAAFRQTLVSDAAREWFERNHGKLNELRLWSLRKKSPELVPLFKQQVEVYREDIECVSC